MERKGRYAILPSYTAAGRATPGDWPSRFWRSCRRRDACTRDLWANRPWAAERIYIGFWTDKGTCDGDTAEFLAGLTHQQVFLFGTAGFGGSPAYLESILNRVRELLPPGVRYLGGFMCQGEMPSAVRKRYEAMEDSPRRSAMLENFDRAVGHRTGRI